MQQASSVAIPPVHNVEQRLARSLASKCMEKRRDHVAQRQQLRADLWLGRHHASTRQTGKSIGMTTWTMTMLQRMDTRAALTRSLRCLTSAAIGLFFSIA